MAQTGSEQSKSPWDPSQLILNPVKFFSLIILVILLITGIYIINWPIVSVHDTDMWYHLTGGRYLFQNHEIPQSGFFSYTANDRSWPNYYWLFEALIYTIFSVGGYTGLVIYRASMYLALMGLIAVFLLRRIKEENLSLYFSVIIVLYLGAIMPRNLFAIRPHTWSYLLIVLFLLLLELRPRAALLLPLLAVFWSNIHGVEYPVMMLIGGAYLVEFLALSRKQKGAITKDDKMFAGLLVLLLYAVIVNPFGPALLEAPFKMAPLQSEYIDELAPIPWMKFFTVSFYDLLTASYALVNFLLLISLLSLLIALKGRKIRISHFLLAVGAIGLLTIHNRFRVEAVLLMLPLIKGHPLPASLKPDSYTLKKRVLAGLLLIVITLGYMQYFVKREGKWPLSDTEFPCGIVAFLNRAGEGGRVLNMPNVSGYLEWELYPRYQIFMDLQMVLFNDEDFFQLLNSFRSPDALKRLNKKYRFDFIMAAKDTSPFANVIAACPEYKLVFCDDWGALYAHEKLHPTLVKQYAITGLDPYQGRGEAAWAQASPEKLSLMKQELNKIHSIYDESAYSNLLLAGIALREGKGPQALQHTTTVIENFPETPYGYVMRGDVLLKQNDVDEAIVCYRAALRRIQESQRRSIYLKLANAYGALHNYKLQYKYLKRAISIWDVQTGYRELYYLANVAGEAKDLRNFEFLLKAAYFKCPENEKEAKAKIRWQLRMLEQETALDE